MVLCKIHSSDTADNLLKKVLTNPQAEQLILRCETLENNCLYLPFKLNSLFLL